MKKLIASFVLTLALTAGIASPISAQDQATTSKSIAPVFKGGPNPPPMCPDGNCDF